MPIKTNIKDLKPSKDKFSRKITLLSKGYFAPESFPGGEITVYPWDTVTSEWFANHIRRKGATIHDIVPRISNLNNCPIEKMLASETLLLIMVSRSLLNNDKVSFEAVCPHCNNKQLECLPVPDALVKSGEKAAGYPGYDAVTLRDCKDVVHVRPYTIGDERQLKTIQDSEPRFKHIPEGAMRLAQAIVEVGGGKPDSPQELLTWFFALHPSDQEQLLVFNDSIQPALDPKVTLGCDKPDCGKSFEYTLRLDADFFRRGLPLGPGA